MNQRLTENDVWKLAFERSGDWAGLRDAIWKAIQADREAIREETRAEVMKDHFKPGEPVQYRIGAEWRGGFFAIRPDTNVGWASGIEGVRRPPKKRATTREEDMRAIHEKTGLDWSRPFLGALSPETIKSMVRDLGLPAEVEE